MHRSRAAVHENVLLLRFVCVGVGIGLDFDSDTDPEVYRDLVVFLKQRAQSR
jgi:hypothetical protein